VIGMAHRGRLNVLVNTLGKMPADLFSEFEGKHAGELPAGDVKYHQGFSSDVMTPGGPMHVTLAFNPSHLEIVNPGGRGFGACAPAPPGRSRGRQVLPVLIHGDAAFAGQGVNQECLNLAQTRGYGTGGTVHIIVNNQIGFTTSDPRDTRSSIYCTDVAKMIEAPILHVNGDDPETVPLRDRGRARVPAEFQKDVVIDLVCFRKLGHNEQDEPMVTQPLMYKIIAAHPGTRKLYADRLQAGRDPEGEADADGRYRAAMALDGHHTNKRSRRTTSPPFEVDWSPYNGGHWTERDDTRMPIDELQGARERSSRPFPRTSSCIHASTRSSPTVGRWARASCRSTGAWARRSRMHAAQPGFRRPPLRPGRRTRHVLPSPRRAARPEPRALGQPARSSRCSTCAENQPDFLVIDSVLSEEAVLGFEYGYATASPTELVIWEAQFGDFVERRAGRDRPVHRVGRSEVGPHVRSHDDAAARLRRAGPGAFVGTPRAFPAAVRRLQHAGRRALDARADVPPAAPADDASVPQAADHDESRRACCATRKRVVARGTRRRSVPDGHRRVDS
jgi:2-oxoglutarate dehydrogenase E1 component